MATAAPSLATRPKASAKQQPLAASVAKAPEQEQARHGGILPTVPWEIPAGFAAGGGVPRAGGKRLPSDSHNQGWSPAYEGLPTPQVQLSTDDLLPMQFKLAVGAANDPLEAEADAVAERVLRMAGPAPRPAHPASGSVLRRKCACEATGSECKDCSGKHEEKIQRKAQREVVPTEAPPEVHRVLRLPGQPLDSALRKFFEPRFGRDLSRVRLHTDSLSAQSADSVGALAYTVGNHIAFARGQYAPQTSSGRSLLAHELVHTAQQTESGSGHGESAAAENQANTLGRRAALGESIAQAPVTRSGVQLARAPAPYKSPYTETVARELMDQLLQMRRALGGTAREQSQRVGAVAALFDRQGNRLGTVARMNIPKGPASPEGVHAEEQVIAEIQNRIAAGQQIEYTVMAVDQDPCGGRCTPLIKQWRDTPASGTLRTITPQARSLADPSRNVKAKTAWSRMDDPATAPFEPAVPPARDAYIGTRAEHTRVRPPLYKENSPTPVVKDTPAVPGAGAAKIVDDAGGDAAAAVTKSLGKAEEDAAARALEDAARTRITKAAAQATEKDLAETAGEALTKSATTAASKRLANAAIPVIGVAFAAPDLLKGGQDISHGDIVTGLGTIGVALIDIASQGLHLTDVVTEGGGTVLAITIQTWCAAMQLGWETARITQRANELKAYMKAHNNGLPPRKELMDYYGLNDEDILLLENDLYKALHATVSTEDLAKQVRKTLAEIDAAANKPLPQDVTPEDVQKQRAALSKLLVALEKEIEEKRAQDRKERAAADEKRRQQNFDRARQRQAAEAHAAPQQLLPVPGPVQQTRQPPGSDSFGLFGPTTPEPLNGISMQNAELAGTGFGRYRQSLLARYQQLDAAHFPSDEVAKYQRDVAGYVSSLDRIIAAFKKDGSTEWPGVQEMMRLKDAADNEDRSKLMR